MREAQFYDKLNRMRVQCKLCPHKCIILHGRRGVCGVRENRTGKLYSLVYGLPCAANVDNIEKKPLFHFLPGSKTFSIGTAGCNLKCVFCQNWTISQKRPEDTSSFPLSPEEVVKKAAQTECSSISYTYIEPTIFYEYVFDTARLAHKQGLTNVIVTNGFINPAPLKKLCKCIDAANIDLKAFSDEFYVRNCSAKLQPVLEAIKLMKKQGVWIELTNMIIPILNDDLTKIRKMCEWVKKELGTSVPLHFSRFFPHYKLTHFETTPLESLQNAYKIAKEVGIRHVYVGNVENSDLSATSCYKCGKDIVKRHRLFGVSHNKLKRDKCPHCSAKIEGVFKKV